MPHSDLSSDTCGRLRPLLDTCCGRAALCHSVCSAWSQGSVLCCCFQRQRGCCGAADRCDGGHYASCDRHASRLGVSAPLKRLCWSWTTSHWRILFFAFSSVRSASSCNCWEREESRIPTISRIISLSSAP